MIIAENSGGAASVEQKLGADERISLEDICGKLGGERCFAGNY